MANASTVEPVALLQARAHVYDLLSAAFDGQVDVLARAMEDDVFARLADTLPTELDTDALTAATVDTEALEDRLESLCLAPAAKPRPAGRSISRHLNRATKVGMMATLATSLACGYAGRKKAHIGFGTAFVALAGMHMLRYQATLVR